MKSSEREFDLITAFHQLSYKGQRQLLLYAAFLRHEEEIELEARKDGFKTIPGGKSAHKSEQNALNRKKRTLNCTLNRKILRKVW